MLVLTIALFIGLAAGQPHHGPGEAEVSCYHCHGDQCLGHTSRCHHDEICQIRYDPNDESGLEIGCRKGHECTDQISSAAHCPTGGADVHGKCQICCHDDHCLADALNMVPGNHTADASNNAGLSCPGHCNLQDLASCVAHGHVCHDDEFCKLTMDENTNMIEGKCEHWEHLHHCQDEVADHHCDPHHHHCNVACCEDNNCVLNMAGGTATTVATAGSMTTQNAGVLTCSDIQFLSCDNLGPICAIVDCPDVCSRCATGAGGTTAASGCQDTLQELACADVLDVCSSPLLLGYCQKFCGAC